MNEYSSDNKYSQTIVIPCCDTDAGFRLKPASFMDLMQEMAYRAATILHFGYDDLQTHHTAWVLSRMHFKFTDPPAWRDEVRLETWHKGLDGLFFLRDFRMCDRSGRELLSCTSSWLVINTETRRLVRSTDLLDVVPETTMCHDDAIAEHCQKVCMPKDAVPEKVGEHRVAYSDVDIIGHTNNARYMVWAMDCIDYAEVTAAPLKEAKINFIKETVPGELVELYRFRTGDEGRKAWYVEGIAEGKAAFCVELIF